MSALPKSWRDLLRDAAPVCGVSDHQWEFDGGARPCPHPEMIGDSFAKTGSCSQAVYRCSICGIYDYGERGGPGHEDCRLCEYKHLASDQSWWFPREAK